MIDWDQEPEENKGALIKFEGRPNEPDRPKEQTRWQRFLQLFRKKGSRLFDRAESLGEAYAEAEVAKRNSEAEKYAAEAAEAAARADRHQQATMKAVNEEIARIFSDKSVPDAARALQLANLLANNPEIVEQLRTIEQVYTHLKIIHGLGAELEIERRPKSEQVKSEQVDPEVQRIREMLAEPIDELELSERAHTSLKAANIETIGDLVRREESEMLKFRNFGRKSLQELVVVLEDRGLGFGMDIDPYTQDN